MTEKKPLSFCLIGFPLGHSLSPMLHKALFSLSGVDARYALRELAPEQFDAEADQLRSYTGFNITIPHKRRILPFLKQIEPRALRCGAVNTVKCQNGDFYGYNTDAEGFIRALDSAGIPLQGRVLLCGAGGAARMMACEALERGCGLVIATREISGAEAAKNDLFGLFPGASIETATLSGVDGPFDLILNATPAGMFPHIDGCPVAERVVAQAAAVYDAVYNPEQTVLVRTALANGAKASGGLDMLIGQAVAAQEIWTGARFAPDSLRVLHEELAAHLTAQSAGKTGGQV